MSKRLRPNHFILVHECDTDKFENTVNELIDEGFEPQGSVASCYKEGSEAVYLSIGMVRYGKPETEGL